MAEEAKQGQAESAAATVETGTLDQILEVTKIAKNDWEREQSKRQIATVVEEALKGTFRVSKDVEATIKARVADIDRLLTDQLNAIMHAPDFKNWKDLGEDSITS